MSKFPKYGWTGIFLVSGFWIFNWALPGLRTHWAFFPMWLGYCITIDALVFQKKNSSLITRNLRKFIMLFILSVPVWWTFELLNLFTANWYYEGKEYFSDLEFFLLSSLSFSTVMPAVFESAEFASTFSWIKNFKHGFRISDSELTVKLFLAAGLLALILLMILPEYFFPFIWISPYFIIDAINSLKGRKNLFNYTNQRNWKPVLALWSGVMLCAFFWEFWNYFSYPKWIYFLPYLNVLHIFEMPLAGYLGYLPFSLEIYAFYNLIKNDNYLEIEWSRIE